MRTGRATAFLGSRRFPMSKVLLDGLERQASSGKIGGNRRNLWAQWVVYERPEETVAKACREGRRMHQNFLKPRN
jgi:hypothetical protein